MAADQRHLRNDAFDPPVERSNDKDMRANDAGRTYSSACNAGAGKQKR